MAVKFTGDWARVTNFLNRTQAGAVLSAAEQRLKAIGKHILRAIQLHIVRQDLPWRALALATVLTKGHGLVYMETGGFQKNIRMSFKSSADKASFRVGPTRSRVPGSKITYQNLAMLLENGFKHVQGGFVKSVPGRPLWEPTYKELLASSEWADILNSVSFDTV